MGGVLQDAQLQAHAFGKKTQIRAEDELHLPERVLCLLWRGVIGLGGQSVRLRKRDAADALAGGDVHDEIGGTRRSARHKTRFDVHAGQVGQVLYLEAEAAGVRGTDLKTIEQGALLHDIGKIGVRDSI